MVYVAQCLQLPICKRTHAPEEPCVDIVRRKAMKQCLQCPCVPGPSRTDHDLHALLEGNDAFLMDGICGLRGEILLRPNVAKLLGCSQQHLAPTWMRYLDQCQRSLPDRFSEEVCNAILGDDVMHVGPRDTHAIPGLQQWFDSGGTIIGSGRKADDGLPARGTRRTTDETRLRGHSAVELAFELVDADLACQIDGKGLCDRNHARLAGHLLGMAHLIDGKEMEPRIIVDKVVEPARSQAVAGDDTIAITRFA